jgi:hypothetical protein
VVARGWSGYLQNLLGLPSWFAPVRLEPSAFGIAERVGSV